MARELGPLHDKLDFKVAQLGRGLDDSIPDLLLRAEDHAGQLNESAGILDRCVCVYLSFGVSVKHQQLVTTQIMIAGEDYQLIKTYCPEISRTILCQRVGN